MGSQAGAAFRSGRRGRRLKLCHPDQSSRRSSLKEKARRSTRRAPPACASLRGSPSGWRLNRSPRTSTRLRENGPHDHPRVDFQGREQRCAGPPRVVNRQVAAGLIASSSKAPVEGPWIDRRPVVTGEHHADSSFGRSRLPIAGDGQGGDDVVQRRHAR